MPNPTESSNQEWWLAVHRIADLVNRSGVAPEEDRLIREDLADQGFSTDGIGKAMDWVDKASLSGTLMDTLGMLQPVPSGLRVEHALERASLHPRLLRIIDGCRRRGLVTQELAERLVEGLRAMDTRDWGTDEIEQFFADVLGVVSPTLAGQSLSRLLGPDAPDHYN